MHRQSLAVVILGLLCGAMCIGASPATPVHVAPLPTATPRIRLVPLPGNEKGYVIDGTLLQNPASGIEITHAFFIEIHSSSTVKQRECVFFINRKAAPVTHVQFLFSWASRQGAPMGADPLDVYASFVPGGVFAQGKQIARWPTGPLCRHPNANGAWKFFVRVTQVNYQDGASWGTAWHHR